MSIDSFQIVLDSYLISKAMSFFEKLNIYQSSSCVGLGSPRGSTSTASIFPNMNKLVAVWKKLVKNGSVIVFLFGLWRIVRKSFFNCFEFFIRNQVFTDVLLQC